jgi:hypothetical protein
MISARRTKNFTDFVSEQWNTDRSMGSDLTLERCPLGPLPDRPILERLLSTCYYASLLREEDRQVRFRLVFGEPRQFNPESGPPTGLHRLVFSKPRPFHEQELRRLFPAADFHRSLIGVRLDAKDGLVIWGIIHSGPRWIHDLHGGLQPFSPLPASLVVCVTDPGRLTVCRGRVTIASLVGSEIRCPVPEVYDTKWFPKCFESTRTELWALHQAAFERAHEKSARLDPDIVRRIAQQVDRRVISTVRNSRHGGTLVYLSTDQAGAFSVDNAYMVMRYQFAAENARNRFRTLIVQLMNALAEEFGPKVPKEYVVGWNEFVASKSATLSILEEGIMEVAHLVAGLAAMDGAVVLSNKYEVLGCGAQIACDLEKVPVVLRAMDAEANETEEVSIDHFGARHRSVYRLCHAFHDVMAVVISQDRAVQFVKWNRGAVTYWDQVATSVLHI